MESQLSRQLSFLQRLESRRHRLLFFVADIDIRNYAKYILREGAIAEKRELLACIRSKVTMANKQIALA